MRFREATGCVWAIVLALGILLALPLPAAAASATGAVYVLDRGGAGLIVEIDLDTGDQRLVTSGGMLDGPSGMVIDRFDGSLVIVNETGASLIRVDPDTGEQAEIFAGPPLVSPTAVGITSTSETSANGLRVLDPGADPPGIENAGTGNVFTLAAGKRQPREFPLDYAELPTVTPLGLTEGGSTLVDSTAGDLGTGALFGLNEVCFEGDTSSSCENYRELSAQGGDLVEPVSAGLSAAGTLIADTGGAGPGRILTLPDSVPSTLVEGGELVDPRDVAYLPPSPAHPDTVLVADSGAGSLIGVDRATLAQSVLATGGLLSEPVAVTVDLPECGFNSPYKLNYIGTPGADSIDDPGGEERHIDGLGGDDRIEIREPARFASHDLCGGEGDDVLRGSKGGDGLFGGPGDDRLRGTAGEEFMLGGRGADRLNGHGAFDYLSGGAGPDRIRGSGASLRGGPGADVLRGGKGRDRFAAGPGKDVVKARDRTRRRENIDCGPGKDRAIVDRRDRTRHCERVARR